MVEKQSKIEEKLLEKTVENRRKTVENWCAVCDLIAQLVKISALAQRADAPCFCWWASATRAEQSWEKLEKTGFRKVGKTYFRKVGNSDFRKVGKTGFGKVGKVSQLSGLSKLQKL